MHTMHRNVIHAYIHACMSTYYLHHAFIHVYMHAYIHAYIYAYLHKYKQTYVHILMHTHLWMHTFILINLELRKYSRVNKCNLKSNAGGRPCEVSKIITPYCMSWKWHQFYQFNEIPVTTTMEFGLKVFFRMGHRFRTCEAALTVFLLSLMKQGDKVYVTND